MKAGEEEIYNRVRAVIADIATVSEDQITPDALLGEVLGLDSMKFIELLFRLEIEFNIEFFRGSIVEKLGELLAPHAVEQDGVLTRFGALVMRRRMPEVDPTWLYEGMPSAGIETLFTPRTWVRAIREILNARPRTCPNCRSDRLAVVKPSILTCEECGAEVTCTKGEQCLETWAAVAPAPAENAGDIHSAGEMREGCSTA